MRMEMAMRLTMTMKVRTRLVESRSPWSWYTCGRVGSVLYQINLIKGAL